MRYVIFLAIILFVVFIFSFSHENSPEVEIATNNLENIQKVEIGMDTLQVLAIMGSPLDRRKYEGELIYDYEMPSGVSFQCQIIFDNSGKVIFKSLGEEYFKKDEK